MPIYCYVCPKCGHKKQEIRTIAERDPNPLRDICSACAPPLDHAHIPGTNCFVMRRDLTAETLGSSDLPYDRPVFSESMGVAEDQVATAQAQHPWIKYQADGSIRIDSHGEYQRVRKALGYVDRAGYH